MGGHRARDIGCVDRDEGCAAKGDAIERQGPLVEHTAFRIAAIIPSRYSVRAEADIAVLFEGLEENVGCVARRPADCTIGIAVVGGPGELGARRIGRLATRRQQTGDQHDQEYPHGSLPPGCSVAHDCLG